MRKSNRFISDVSIERKSPDQPTESIESLNNISVDGLCFRSSTPIDIGQILMIQIPIVQPVFSARARVIWCTPSAGVFDIGVEFVAVENGSSIKTVEMLQYLDLLRRNSYLDEGRKISSEEAYLELLQKYNSNDLNTKH